MVRFGELTKLISGFPDTKDVFEFVFKLTNSEMKLSELLELHSDDLDKLIINEENKGNRYISGEFTVRLLNDDFFELCYEMYFKNSKDAWIKKSNKSNPLKTAALSKDTIEYLKSREDGLVVYEIDAPSKQ